MSDEYLAVSRCERSGRHAILACDSHTAWVYLHAPGSDEGSTGPVQARCFAFNLCELIDRADVKNYRPAPPPIAEGFGSDLAVCREPAEHNWQLVWSRDGNAILLLNDEAPWCLTSTSEPDGHSKAIRAKGPWGDPWSETVFSTIDWDSPAPEFR